jgi:hypothetical protein
MPHGEMGGASIGVVDGKDCPKLLLWPNENPCWSNGVSGFGVVARDEKSRSRGMLVAKF